MLKTLAKSMPFYTALFISCFQAHAQLATDYATEVFQAGESGYKCFRIPAIIATRTGVVVAFCEARKKGCSDTGDIDLVMKRSTDEGRSWGELKVIWDDGANTCGNPAPVVELESGKIVLLSTWNLGEDHEKEIIEGSSIDTRRIYYLSSMDEGLHWSKPKEITSNVKMKDWSWYATGPGSGIQLNYGTYRGRMMVACDHIEKESKKYYSHVIYSDDQGVSWNLGGTSPKDQVNESEVVELTDGSLMLNMRNYDRDHRYRQIAISHDGGYSWGEQTFDPQLPEPICQASIQRWTYPYEGKARLLFSNPASKEKRHKMTVKMSEDEGKSWSSSVLLHEGPAAYSDLVILSNGKPACLFESGENSPYERIVFWLGKIED